MRKCIICGKSETELMNGNTGFTEEHIIPRALWNKTIVTKNVCCNCNSKMGKTIDAKFLASFDIKTIRDYLEPGNNSNKRDIFAIGKDENNRTVTIYNDLKLETHPTVTKDGQRITIETQTKEKAKEITKKICIRNNLNEEKTRETMDKIDNIEPNKIVPEISISIAINKDDVRYEMIKIAYEYATIKLPEEYLEDERAKELSNLLFDRINNKICNIDKYFLNYNSNIMKQYNESLKFHLIKLEKVDNLLIVAVMLFMRGDCLYNVVVSENANNYVNNNDPDFAGDSALLQCINQ